MRLTQEELEAASRYVQDVRLTVLEAVSTIPSPAELDEVRAIMASIDGIIAAAAMSAAAMRLAPTNRDKRRLADEVRTAFLKSMNYAEAELAEPDGAD